MTATAWLAAALAATPLLGGCSPARDPLALFVAQLDRVLRARDFAAFDAMFADGLHREHRLQLEACLKKHLVARPGVDLASRVVERLPRGEVTAAVVETTFRADGKAMRRRTVLAIREVAGETRGVLIAHVPLTASIVQNRASFTCAACNYTVGFGEDWLALPVASRSGRCMEALLLLSVKADLHVEAAIEIGCEPSPARAILARCKEKGEDGKILKHEATYRPWQPRFLAQHTGCRTEWSSGRLECLCPGDHVAEMNLVVHGQLRYLFVVRGPQDLVTGHRAAIDAVLGSFRPIDPQVGAEQLLAKALHAHTGGGRFAGQRYVNDTYRVAIDTPEGWRNAVRPGPYLFQLTSTEQQTGEHLVVEAFAPPRDTWTRELVDQTIADSTTGCANRCDGWQEGTAGFAFRDVWLADKQRLLRFAMRSDVLVVLDGDGSSPERQARALAVMQSLAAPQ